MKFFKKIIDFIKNIVLKENDNKEERISGSNYDDLYSEIDTGSIIWAKRYTKDKDPSTLTEGHNVGPYLVAKKEDNKLYCFYGTSKDQDINISLFLNSFDYLSLTKHTYFKLFNLEVIDEFSLIRVLDTLKEKDKNSLYRKIKALNKIYHTHDGKIINIDLPRQIGDIISIDDKKYVILDIKKEELTCVPIKYVNKKASNFDFSKIITINNSSKISCIGVLNNEKLVLCLNKYKEYINNIKNINNTQRGSIILKDQKYYYVYGIEGQDLLAFEIKTDMKQGYNMLNINNKTFYTKYKEAIINKKSNYKNLYLCFESEKDYVKKQRKSYKNSISHQNIEDLIMPESFRINSVIKLNEFSEEEFYIKQIIDNILVCGSLSEKGHGRSKTYYFNKDNVILVRNYQKRK